MFYIKHTEPKQNYFMFHHKKFELEFFVSHFFNFWLSLRDRSRGRGVAIVGVKLPKKTIAQVLTSMYACNNLQPCKNCPGSRIHVNFFEVSFE